MYTLYGSSSEFFTPHCSQQYLKNPSPVHFDSQKKSVQILKLVTKIVRITFLINHHILEFQVFSFGVN